MARRTLKLKSPLMSGEDVRVFQENMLNWGFIILVDSIYGEESESVCKKFQTMMGLKSDGICGTKTWNAILAGTRTLKKTSPLMKGVDVSEFQTRMQALGYNITKIDGKYGAECEAACKELQKAANITVDGICGKATWASLRAGIKPGTVTPTPTDDVVTLLNNWGFAGVIKQYGKAFAIKEFQAAMSLTADGIVGEKTMAAFKSTIIVPRIEEPRMKCQCAENAKKLYCNGYPKGDVSIGIRILGERVMRKVEKVYPGVVFYIPSYATPSASGSLAGGYRCTKWNKERGGASGSRHLYGDAMDIFGSCAGVTNAKIRQKIEDVAMSMNVCGGVGYGAANIVHIDTRGTKARWKYSG